MTSPGQRDNGTVSCGGRGAIVPEPVVTLDPETIGTADTTPYTFGLQNQGQNRLEDSDVNPSSGLCRQLHRLSLGPSCRQRGLAGERRRLLAFAERSAWTTGTTTAFAMQAPMSLLTAPTADLGCISICFLR